MKLPTHITCSIEHNTHRVYHEEIDFYVTHREWDDTECPPDDKAQILATGECWEIQWYPNNSVGSHTVAAATLERALALANGE